ncbi:type II toxin-antitoxin system MqsA family antitoxin [Pseudomonas sp. NPDC007930]|uniref:helix-turn-helix domain-containing protein n=1 Tax=Pseudomonas sp. NPDC007930 TaxID=3364417 RepID=UPI0036EB709C
MTKRNLFAELMEGVEEMAQHREGRLTLRQFEVDSKPVPSVSADEIVALREKLHMSQPVFAQCFRVSTGTLRKWEQSKARPNVQASLLFRLVERYPDMFDRIVAL